MNEMLTIVKGDFNNRFIKMQDVNTIISPQTQLYFIYLNRKIYIMRVTSQ